ncbi:MAG: hypothetical protein EON93_14040 [Burkholderiales bacterium]|nr:MAG: hypothetical protein EON93_14040 [Burkholderiales bacterium]
MTKKQDENGEGPGTSASAGDTHVKKPLRDVHEANLEDLLAQIYDAAEDSFAEARQLAHDRDTQVEVLMQAAALSKAYAQILTARNRHRKALNDEEG